MADLNKIRGFSALMTKFKEQGARYDPRLERGLIAAGLFLFMKTQPHVPVDWGELKGSGFVRTSKVVAEMGPSADVSEIANPKPFVVQIGYTASYALFVHENLDAAHGQEYNIKHAAEIAAGTEHTRGPGQEAKFLENQLRDPSNRAQMKTLIKEQLQKS